MEELTDIRDKGKTQVKDNYNSIQDTNVRIDLDCSYTQIVQQLKHNVNKLQMTNHYYYSTNSSNHSLLSKPTHNEGWPQTFGMDALMC